MIIFPVVELFDRLAIAEVKFQRTEANQEELSWYMNQASAYNLDSVNELFNQLVEIHHTIWDLEAELKSGREAELPLEEIGRRAIQIRNHNNRRVAIKNQIAEKLGSSVKEIKRDHLSE